MKYLTLLVLMALSLNLYSNDRMVKHYEEYHEQRQTLVLIKELNIEESDLDELFTKILIINQNYANKTNEELEGNISFYQYLNEASTDINNVTDFKKRINAMAINLGLQNNFKDAITLLLQLEWVLTPKEIKETVDMLNQHLSLNIEPTKSNFEAAFKKIKNDSSSYQAKEDFKEVFAAPYFREQILSHRDRSQIELAISRVFLALIKNEAKFKIKNKNEYKILIQLTRIPVLQDLYFSNAKEIRKIEGQPSFHFTMTPHQINLYLANDLESKAAIHQYLIKELKENIRLEKLNNKKIEKNSNQVDIKKEKFQKEEHGVHYKKLKEKELQILTSLFLLESDRAYSFVKDGFLRNKDNLPKVISELCNLTEKSNYIDLCNQLFP